MAVKFTGLNELRVGLTKRANLDIVKKVVQQNGAEMQQKAQSNAPVDTGTLKRSIGLEMSDGGLTATTEATTDYAPYQEWGTRFMEAQPYMKPAFDAQKERFKQQMNKIMK